jgi:hypothetical protein
MTAPGPVPGTNPHTLSYQSKQFDTTWPPHESVLDALANPPAAGIAAETTPDHLFAENTDPPVGSGGNTGDGSQIGIG